MLNSSKIVDQDPSEGEPPDHPVGHLAIRTGCTHVLPGHPGMLPRCYGEYFVLVVSRFLDARDIWRYTNLINDKTKS